MVDLPISRTQEILLYSSREGCIQLTVVILTFKTDGFFLLLKTLRPLCSMLGYSYNRTIYTRKNTKVLINISLGAGGRRKKEVESSSLPKTFDDDYSLFTAA